MRRRSRLIFCAAPLSLAIVSPVARAFDSHFDYTSFETGFGQSQFDVLNYPSINGNYMMTSTDNHRPEMVANGNALAQFYNNFLADYNTQSRAGNINAVAEADAINAYSVANSTKNGAKPTWLILNEISASLWPQNPGAPGLSTYRQWVIDCVTRLHDVHGFNVITYSPFATPGSGSGSNASSWQALAAKSYIGIENYLSGPEVMAGGTDYASRVAWARTQYLASKTAYTNAGVDFSLLFLGEHFGNTAATYTDSTGTHATGWGRAGLASASDWDTVLQIRQDAIRSVGFPGFLAYNWGGNGMGITTAEQIQHEYWYRTRLVLPGQQPQWLSDSAINVNGTVIPLSWNEQLNWLGGVPNASGAIANFYRTNSAARTIMLDGAKIIGTLSFNSASSYNITAGTGGGITLNNGASPASLSVPTGSHTIAVPVALSGNATFSIVGSLSFASGFSTIAPGTITRTGSGTLNIAGTQSYTASTVFSASAGTTNLNSSATNLGLTVGTGTINLNAAQTLGAVTLTAGGKVNSLATNATHNVASLAITGGQLDLADDAMIIRSGTLGSPAAGVYSGLTSLIQTGRNNGNWTGNGIITTRTSAKTPSILTTLAIAKASDAFNLTGTQTATWRSQTVDANAILIMYTYAGDANLNGKINADDYFQIDSNINKPSASVSYFHGDFNYDGKIDGDDYFLIDSNFVGQGSPFASEVGVSVVPEVSGVFVFALGAIGCGVRRCAVRRRRVAC